jgi:hypothetical protein
MERGHQVTKVRKQDKTKTKTRQPLCYNPKKHQKKYNMKKHSHNLVSVNQKLQTITIMTNGSH